MIPWLKNHSHAILLTAVLVQNFELIPKWIGSLASVLVAVCGASPK